MSGDVSSLVGNLLTRLKIQDPDSWNDLTIASRRGGPTVSWRGTVPLEVIPLVNSRGNASGYVLTSTDERLPPFLEYASEGPPLTEALLTLLREPMRAAGIDAEPLRFIFVTSSEVYAEYDLDARGRLFVRVPDLMVIPYDDMRMQEQDPGLLFDGAEMAKLWEVARGREVRTGPDMTLPCRPVLYNQGCDRYSRAHCVVDLESSRGACAPNRIAGCVAVGWAMMLSAWKRYVPAAAKIWPGSACWSKHWSTGMPPERCSDVNSSIWRLHRMLNTGADGNTSWSDLHRGSAIFRDFGIGFNWGNRENATFEFCCSVIEAKQPFLWCATGAWGVRSGPPGVGHGVCAFGFSRANRSLHIGLGWGEDYPHKYIAFDQFRGHSCFFVTRTRVDQTDDDEPMLIDLGHQPAGTVPTDDKGRCA